MKDLQIKFDHPNIEKTLEFWDKKLMLISSIRSEIMLYKAFVNKGAENEANNVLSSIVGKIDESMKLDKEMSADIEKALKVQNEPTKTMEFGKVIFIDTKKAV